MILRVIRRLIGALFPRRAAPALAVPIGAVPLEQDSGPLTIFEPLASLTLPARAKAPQTAYKALHAVVTAPSIDEGIGSAFRLYDHYDGRALFASTETVVVASFIASAYIKRFIEAGIARTASYEDRLCLLYGGLMRSDAKAFRAFMAQTRYPVDQMADRELRRAREVIRMFLMA